MDSPPDSMAVYGLASALATVVFGDPPERPRLIELGALERDAIATLHDKGLHDLLRPYGLCAPRGYGRLVGREPEGPLDRSISVAGRSMPAWWALRELDAKREARAAVGAALDAAFPGNAIWELCLDVFSGAYGDRFENVLGPDQGGVLVAALAGRPDLRPEVEAYLSTLARAMEAKTTPRASILSVSTCLGALARWGAALAPLPATLVAFGVMGDGGIARDILERLPDAERETVLMAVPSGKLWSIPAFDLVPTETFAKTVVGRVGAGVSSPMRPLALAALAALGDKGRAAIEAHLAAGGADKNGLLDEALRSSRSQPPK